jgi:glycine cleavage system aminomethyltransferase T
VPPSELCKRTHPLQKIITNDATKLTPGGPPLYACVLTPHGRFMHDMFLHPLEGAQVPTVLVDCDSGQRRALMDLFQRWVRAGRAGRGSGRAWQAQQPSLMVS